MSHYGTICDECDAVVINIHRHQTWHRSLHPSSDPPLPDFFDVADIDTLEQASRILIGEVARRRAARRTAGGGEAAQLVSQAGNDMPGP